ncbi:lasso RiPP family leader peptide-containing protein [Allokutzneria oryzae]|uniref:Lasso RiPP family leader peptide-containing protein n=1 Tax=Allokutzneria oryzae TaxID=1378989 RepID=A0ABV6A8T6_9PSEU
MKSAYEAPKLIEAGTFATATGRHGYRRRDRRWRGRRHW